MILVTGGAGFIGSNFVLDWLAAVGEPALNCSSNYGPHARLITHVNDRPGHDGRHGVDPGKLEALGWRPAESFESGLRTTVKWYLGRETGVRDVRSGACRQWLDRNYTDR